VIGATFGATPQLDAFWAAFKIPNALFELLVAGALASAFIPVFAGYLAKEREKEAWHVASSVMNVLILSLVGVSAVLSLAAPFLGIHALALGVVVGAAMMFLVQVPELTFRRTKYEIALDLAHPGVREVFLLAGPRTFSLAAVQIVFFVDTYLAPSMPAGSLTALNYAFQLMLLPLGVFSIAISAAVFPTLSQYASLGQAAKMRDALQQAIRWILFLTLPTAILMVVLRRPIVNLLFQYGAFDADARELTQAAFLFYSLGLAGHALIQILARAYYATRDTTTPVALTLVSIGANVMLSVTLAPQMGINGLALANSIATLAEAALL